MVLTSNNTSYVTADGNKVNRRRIRYICYQKTRHRCLCSGQTGYTAHILDEKVEHVIYRLLEQLGSVEESFLLQDICFLKKSSFGGKYGMPLTRRKRKSRIISF